MGVMKETFEEYEKEIQEYKNKITELEDALDANHMMYLSQVSLWKSRYAELEKSINKDGNKKQHLEYTSGCTATSLTVDKVETVNMDKEDVKTVIKKLVDNENDLGLLQMMFEYLMESQGKYENLGQCESCGDYTERYALDI